MKQSVYSESLFDQGRLAFSHGQLELGQELMQDALQYHEQIFGAIHPEMADHYIVLASLYHQQSREDIRKLTILDAAEQEVSEAKNGDESTVLKRRFEALRQELGVEDADMLKVQAEGYVHSSVRMLRQAVVILERTKGLDHPETVHAYSELSVLEHSAGNIDLGFRIAKYTLHLLDAVYGPGHPDQLKLVVSVSSPFFTPLLNYDEMRRETN